MTIPNFCKSCLDRLDGGPGYCLKPACRSAARETLGVGPDRERLADPQLAASQQLRQLRESVGGGGGGGVGVTLTSFLAGGGRGEASASKNEPAKVHGPIPKEARRIIERKDRYRRVVEGFGHYSVMPGGQVVRASIVSQGLFRPLRILAIMDEADRKTLVLESLVIGADFIFNHPVPLGIFADKIPTSAEVAESDVFDDGSRVDYPVAGPGITISMSIKNEGPMSPRPANVHLAMLGLYLPMGALGEPLAELERRLR